MMKSLTFHIIRRAVFLFVLQYCFFQFSFSQCWVYEKSGTSYDLTSVCFTDSLTGTAVGDGGVVLRTTNGGSTWNKLPIPTTALLTSVSFVDKNFGWVCCNLGPVLYTSDGGTSWNIISVPYPCLFLVALDSNTALFAGDGVNNLIRTTDRGATWATVFSGGSLYASSFANSSVGHLTTSQGIYRTTDGGLTWAKKFNQPNLIGVFTLNANIAVAADYSHFLWRTNDGANSWLLQDSLLPTGPYGYIENWVSLADSLHGVLVNSKGEEFLTTDGGADWIALKEPSVPNVHIAAVACAGINSACAVGDYGTIMKMVNDCSQAFTPNSPLNGDTLRVTNQTMLGHYYVPLQWDYPDYVTIASTRVQGGTDSTFSNGLMLDTSISYGSTWRPNIATLVNVGLNKTYYWRVKVKFADSTSAGWSDTWKFTTGGSSISGSLFNDDNADNIREAGETGLANWRLDITGKIQGSVYTDSNGIYSLGGLDSGTYIITQQPQAVWLRTFPSFASYVLTVGVHDNISGIDFGDAWPWNSFAGTVYWDVNENGIKDAFEPVMAHCVLTLFGPDSNAVTQTDSLGHYIFQHVSPGTNTVALTAPPPYEQETPRYQQGYAYDIQTYGDQYTGFDFGVHKIPVRVKVPLTIYDNTLVNRRDIWFGIRPGATYGIWGVDPKATTVDFSESEFEIPPPTFGLFDARFQDPHGGTAQFGAGSWTDMRDFFSTSQRDTFFLTFTPGYYFSGNYPMTIQWSRQDVHSAFPTVDPVLIDPKGNRIDMWNGSGDTAKVIISDSTIFSLSIVTEAPNITFTRRWNMVSLPQTIFDNYVHNLFTTANSHAFAYAPGAGYIIQDTLHSGKGYWVNYSSAVDSLKANPPARLLDSITLQPGWNMIGTLSAPVSINQITTNPSGIYSSRFFGYDRGYSVTDTLLPAKGYWIKASQSAKMFMNASGAVPKTAIENNLLTASSILSFQDNTGNREQLYCRTAQAGDTNDLYEAPPLPPDGEFDVRFSSNRILETIGEKQTGKFPVVIQGAEFPITLSWQGNTSSVKASIVIDGKETFLNGKATIRITNPSSSIVLNLFGIPAIPSAFALQQNYPNPFNPTTKFSYSVPKTSQVSIKIYDVLGREVVTLVNEKKDPGEYSLTWTAASIPSGVYFYRMSAGNFVQTKKMVLLK